VSSTTDGGENSDLRRDTHRALYVAYICASGYQSGLAIKHAVPDTAHVFVVALARAQQVTFEPAVERTVDLIASRGHLLLS
jgi:hypothetical protein